MAHRSQVLGGTWQFADFLSGVGDRLQPSRRRRSVLYRKKAKAQLAGALMKQKLFLSVNY